MLLHVPHLDKGFFRDGERFNEHRHISQLIWNRIHVLLVIDNVLRHEAVLLFNAPFGEVAGETEILAAVDASHAITVWAWASNHGYDQVADFYATHLVADFNHFTEGFVPDDQILSVRRRRAILESADLFVGAADAGFDHAQLDVRRGRNFWLRPVDEADLFCFGYYGDGSHKLFSCGWPVWHFRPRLVCLMRDKQHKDARRKLAPR